MITTAELGRAHSPRFLDALMDRLATRFADDGIRAFFAERLRTNEPCWDDICVNRDQFAEVIRGSQPQQPPALNQQRRAGQFLGHRHNCHVHGERESRRRLRTREHRSAERLICTSGSKRRHRYSYHVHGCRDRGRRR